MLSSFLSPRLQQAPPEDDIYDIVVLAPKESILPLLLLGIGVLLVLILLGLLLWWNLRKKGTGSAVSPRSKVLQQLRHLELRETTMEPNRFAQELSDSLKDYLGERYREPVRYETAQEYLERSSRLGAGLLPEAAAEELRQFLSVAEEVKFGNTTQASSLTSSLLQRARSVVELCDIISQERVPAPPSRR